MTSTNNNQRINNPAHRLTSKQILSVFFVSLSCFFSAAFVSAATSALPAATLKSVTITDSASKNVPPHAVIKYTNHGNTVNFDASGSSDTDGTIASYKWKFGDGTTGTGVKVVHVYSHYGTFPVTLTVIDDTGGVALSQVNFKHNLNTGWGWGSKNKTPSKQSTGWGGWGRVKSHW